MYVIHPIEHMQGGAPAKPCRRAPTKLDRLAKNFRAALRSVANLAVFGANEFAWDTEAGFAAPTGTAPREAETIAPPRPDLPAPSRRSRRVARERRINRRESQGSRTQWRSPATLW